MPAIAAFTTAARVYAALFCNTNNHLCPACVCRFVGLSGIVAFDLDSFLSMAQRSRKWQDPHTLRNVTIKQLQRDSWMQPVITCLKVLLSSNLQVTFSTLHLAQLKPESCLRGIVSTSFSTLVSMFCNARVSHSSLAMEV